MNSKPTQAPFKSFREQLDEIDQEEQCIRSQANDFYKCQSEEFPNNLTDQNNTIHQMSMSTQSIGPITPQCKRLSNLVQTVSKLVEDRFEQYGPLIKLLDTVIEYQQNKLVSQIEALSQLNNHIQEISMSMNEAEIYELRHEFYFQSAKTKSYTSLKTQFKSLIYLGQVEPLKILLNHYKDNISKFSYDDLYIYLYEFEDQQECINLFLEIQTYQQQCKVPSETNQKQLLKDLGNFIKEVTSKDFFYTKTEEQEDLEFQQWQYRQQQEEEIRTEIIFSEDENAQLKLLIQKFQTNPELEEITIDEAFRLPVEMGLNHIGAFNLKTLKIKQIHKESQCIINLVREGVSLEKLTLQGIGINSYLGTIYKSENLKKLTIKKYENQDENSFNQLTIDIISKFKNLQILNLTDYHVSEDQIEQLQGFLLELKQLKSKQKNIEIPSLPKKQQAGLNSSEDRQSGLGSNKPQQSKQNSSHKNRYSECTVEENIMNAKEEINTVKTVQNRDSQPLPETNCIVEDQPGDLNNAGSLQSEITVPFEEQNREKEEGEESKLRFNFRNSSNQDMEQGDNLVEQESPDRLQNDIAFNNAQKETTTHLLKNDHHNYGINKNDVLNESYPQPVDQYDQNTCENLNQLIEVVNTDSEMNMQAPKNMIEEINVLDLNYLIDEIEKEKVVQILVQPEIIGIFNQETKENLVPSAQLKDLLYEQEDQPDDEIQKIQEELYAQLSQQCSSGYNPDDLSFFLRIKIIGQDLQNFLKIIQHRFYSLNQTKKQDIIEKEEEKSKSTRQQVSSESKVQQWVQKLLKQYDILKYEPQEDNNELDSLNKKFKEEEFKDEFEQMNHFKQRFLPQRGIGIIDKIIQKQNFQQLQESDVLFDVDVFQKLVTKLFVDIVLKEIESRKGLIVPLRILKGVENGIVILSKELYKKSRTLYNSYKKILIIVNSNKRQEQVINRFEQYFYEKKEYFLNEQLKLQKIIQTVIDPYKLQDLKGYHFIEEQQFVELFKVFKQINQKKAAKQGIIIKTSWESNIEENDVFVFLSRNIQELLIHGEIKINTFDIIAFDEIHTIFPEHPYNSIMTSFYYNDSSQKKLPFILGFFNLSIFNEPLTQIESKILEKLMTYSNMFNGRLLTFSSDQIKAIRHGYLSELKKMVYVESTPFQIEQIFQYLYQLDKLILKYFQDSPLQIKPHPNIFELKKLKPFLFIHNAITGSKCTTSEAKWILENFGNKVLEIRKLLKIDNIINSKKQSKNQETQINSNQIQTIYKIDLQTIQYVKEKNRYFSSRFEIKEDMKLLFDDGLEYITRFDPAEKFLLHKQKLEAENWIILKVIQCLQHSRYIRNDLRPDQHAIEQRFREVYIDELNQLKTKEELEETKRQVEEKQKEELRRQELEKSLKAQKELKQLAEEEIIQWFLKLDSFIKIVLNPILNAQSKYKKEIKNIKGRGSLVSKETSSGQNIQDCQQQSKDSEPNPLTIDKTKDDKIQKEEEKDEENFLVNFSSSKYLKELTDTKTAIYDRYQKICKEALGIDDSDQKQSYYERLYKSIGISIKEDLTMTEEARVKEKEDKQQILLCLLVYALMEKPHKNLIAEDLTQIKTEIARLAFNGDTAINLCVVQYLYFFKDSLCNEKALDKQKIEKVRSSNLRLKSESYKLDKYMISINSDKPSIGRDPGELLQTLCGYLSLYFGFDACFLFLNEVDLLQIVIEGEKTPILNIFSQKYRIKVKEYQEKTEIFEFITKKQGKKAMKQGQQFSFESIKNMFKQAASKQKGEKEDSIKKLLKYPNILLEAFTHKSFSEKTSKITDESISEDEALSWFNYQRLEYLGDSLLNYTLSHLFYYESMQEKKNYPYFPASKQHEMKTWFSSNHLNSFLLVELYFKSPKMNLSDIVPLLYDDQNQQYEQQLLEYQKQVQDKLKKYKEKWKNKLENLKKIGDTNELAQTRKDCQEDLQMAGLQEEYIKYFSDVLESMIGAIYLATGDFAFTQKCIIDLRLSALLDFYPIKENDRTRVLVNWNSKPYAQVLKLTHAVEENEKGTYVRGYIQSMEVIRIKFAKYQKNKVSKFYQDFGRYLDQAYKNFEKEQENKQDISSKLIKTKDGRIITQWQLTETHWIEFNRFFRKTYNSNVQAEKTTVIFLEIGTKLKKEAVQYTQDQLTPQVKEALLLDVFKTLKNKSYFEFEAERVNNIKIREIVALLNIKCITKVDKKKYTDKEEYLKEKTTKEDQEKNFMTKNYLSEQNTKKYDMESANTCFLDDLSLQQKVILFDEAVGLAT